MRRVGQTRRRDANEKPIRDALEALGKRTTPVSGKGAPDVIVGPLPRCQHCGRNALAFEVKTKTGTRTDAQKDSLWPIVRTIEEALEAIRAQR